MNVKDFKGWLVENGLDGNELFVESLICYNNGAYKGAYLLSYLGFVEGIRDMIIEYDEVPLKFEEKMFSEIMKTDATKKDSIRYEFGIYVAKNYPNEKGILSKVNTLTIKDCMVRNFSKVMWRRRVDILKEDDTWDEEFKNLILEAEYNIFLLNQSTRDEFRVKKDLRNVCAHNKSRGITDATVEDLWDYIKWVKPLVVINGAEQLLIDNIKNVVRFSNASEYQVNARDIYRSYMALGNEKRKIAFEKICEMVYHGSREKEFLSFLFEHIFEKKDCPEIDWIKKNIGAELFAKLNVNNYNCEINKAQLYEKMQTENIEDNQFPISIVFEFFRKCVNEQRKIMFVKEIYNQENNYTHWLDLVISSDDENFYLKNEDILNIIIQENHLACLFEDIKKLYSYSSQYGRGTTNTFDYCSFGGEKITRKVLLALWLIKENKINLTDNAKELVRRCVNIVNAAKEYPNGNDAVNDRILKENKAIYEWICAQGGIV